ncbi:DUF3040 domain-containing protein [Actinomadura rupiterrae]|uniref:DUF3040 domain-containing protein n=1 Tax=Actinomadura rupiterrae TaxID=559627 RepID=UPI0020A5B31C|nr:DUF3040 domain-containing protein [Actinomadura rupiterrae]MCP2338303.1 hypothetical protein [Actinomadura rupiterrae]
MPLSDHEQRMLDQIEQALYAEDPKFAHAVRSTSPQVHYKRQMIKAALGFAVGVCALMAGLVANAGAVTIAVSVAGFLLMVACCVWALTSWKRMTGIAEPARGGRRAASGGGRSRRSQRSGFMERMEERWRRRTEER